MAAAQETIKPPMEGSGPAGWMRANLFNTWYNSLLTVVIVTVLFLAFKPALLWAFGAADWSPITANLKLFLAGQYPLDQMWRVGVSVLIFSAVFGVAWGVWGGVARNFALLIAIGLGALAFVPLVLQRRFKKGCSGRTKGGSTLSMGAYGLIVAPLGILQPQLLNERARRSLERRRTGCRIVRRPSPQTRR